MRRFLICLLLCTQWLGTAVLAQPSPTSAPQRILTLDWTVAETLAALGHAPLGLAQIGDYHSWIGEPRMPSSTVDLGLRNQPSMELMAELQADVLLITPMFSHMAARLESVAPVQTIAMYDPKADAWQALEAMTRTLGALTHSEAQAEALIADTEQMLTATREQVQGCGPLLVMQLADDKHVRIYGGNSLYQQVLDRLGIQNAWPGSFNDWGYRLLSLPELAPLRGRAVIIAPIPLGSLQRLQDNSLWQRLPIVSEHPPVVLPAVWSLGGLPSAQRFARLLESDVCPK